MEVIWCLLPNKSARPRCSWCLPARYLAGRNLYSMCPTQVKADAGSLTMEGLKDASMAVRKATDELVKAAQGTHEKTPFLKVKKNIFKEVRKSPSFSIIICSVCSA